MRGQSLLHGPPLHWVANQRLDRSVDLLRTHRLVPLGEHLDDGLEHPTSATGSLAAGTALAHPCIGLDGGQILDDAPQPALWILVREDSA